MRRFGGLVVNEYVKILCKTSTKVLLIAVIIVALGYNALLYVGINLMSDYATSHNYWGADDYIKQAQEEQYDGWERDVDIYTYLKENDISVDYYYINGQEAPDTWRRNAVYSLFFQKDEIKAAENEDSPNEENIKILKKYVEDLDNALKNKDWKLYYSAELSLVNMNIYSTDDEKSDSAWHWQYLIDNEIAPDNWKYQLVRNVVGFKYDLRNLSDVTENDERYEQKIETQNMLAIAEYRLENDVEKYTYDGIESMMSTDVNSGLWDIFAGSTMTISIISVLIIVIAGSLLSSEFSAGTVKFLLINPVKRWKIVVAKYVSVLSITLAAVFALYIFNMVFSGIFFGFSSFGAPFLSAENGKVIVGSSFLFVAGRYLIGSVGMICMATFAFAISSLVRNSALSIGLGVFLVFSGNTVVTILHVLGIYQAKYILFANTDLLAVINGNTGFINHTLGFALINIAVYMLVFLWTAWDGFVRNDIK